MNNSRKLWMFAGGVAIIILIVLVVVANSSSKNNTKKTANGTTATKSTSKYPIHEACNILTSDIAKQLAGSDATSSPQSDTQANAVNVSICSYYGATSKLSLSLLARSPLDASAAASNVNQFGTGKPVGVQLISGYGTSAYWYAHYGQLNILKNNTWYILNFGPASPSQDTVAQTEQLANLIIDKL